MLEILCFYTTVEVSQVTGRKKGGARMGFFDKLRSGKKDYPVLDGTSMAADRIEKIRDHLESLSKRVHKPLEVIPGEDGSYIFIGKPPKDFGVAWIEGSKLHSFKTLVEEDGVNPKDLPRISEDLRKAYEQNLEDARFTTKIGNKDIVVTPSEGFRAQVREIIHQAGH